MIGLVTNNFFSLHITFNWTLCLIYVNNMKIGILILQWHKWVIYMKIRGLFDIILQWYKWVIYMKIRGLLYIIFYINILLLLIWGSFWSLQVMPLRILGGQSKKIEKFYKFSQKLKTSGHQFGNSNHNSHWICYLF